MTGGGSGGHITPLLSLARELKKQSPNCQLVYVGFKGDNFDSLKFGNVKFDFTVFINAGKFRRYHGESLLSHLFDLRTLALNVRDLFRLIRSIGTALRLINKFKPNLIFSKGGFVAVPVGIAARLRGVPIITHDSDSLPGLANRIIGRWAILRTTGMPSTGSNYSAGNTKFVGIPLSDKVSFVGPKDQARFKAEIGLPRDCQMLLIGSAGNGSIKLNELVLKSAATLLKANPRLYIIHIAGLQNLEKLNAEYAVVLDADYLKRVKTLGFASEFYKYSGAADIIVGRAGATSLSEFALQAKACIIIPSPFLANGHQLKNAEQLKANDAAVVLDNNVEPDEFIVVVNNLLGDANRRQRLASNLTKQAVPDSARRLTRILLETTGQGRK